MLCFEVWLLSVLLKPLSVIFSDDDLYCKLTQEISSGDALVAILSSAAQQASTQTHKPPVKEEPEYPATLPSDIQLLPQQAGMAAILATAVVNSELLISYKIICVCVGGVLPPQSSVIRIESGQGLKMNKL